MMNIDQAYLDRLWQEARERQPLMETDKVSKLLMHGRPGMRRRKNFRLSRFLVGLLALSTWIGILLYLDPAARKFKFSPNYGHEKSRGTSYSSSHTGNIPNTKYTPANS